MFSKIEQDFVTLEDGFVYFWVTERGAMSASLLRKIADRLDELNKPYADEIDKYFKTRGQNNGG